MIDHFGINCADLPASAAFYDKVLGVLGFGRVLDFEVALGYGPPGKPDFWIGTQPEGEGPSSGPNREVHIAFVASSADAVRAFHDAAVLAGRRGPPRAPPLARVPRPLLRRLRPRPRRQQRRGCVSHGGAGVACKDTR